MTTLRKWFKARGYRQWRPNESIDLQMFEFAEKYVKQSDPGFEIVGNYMSPCSDAYQKSSLAPAHHRIQSRLSALNWESVVTLY